MRYSTDDRCRAHASGYTPKGQHRLSVPDLAELTHGKSMNGASNGVATSAKALTSRLGRSPATGELQVHLVLISIFFVFDFILGICALRSAVFIVVGIRFFRWSDNDVL